MPKAMPGSASEIDIENNLRKWIAKSMQISPDSIEPAKPFTAYGVDSLAAFELICQIEETYDLTIPTNLIWDYPTAQARRDTSSRR